METKKSRKELAVELIASKISDNGMIPSGKQAYPDLLAQQRDFIGISLLGGYLKLDDLTDIVDLSKPNIIYHKKVFIKRYNTDEEYKKKIDEIYEYVNSSLEKVRDMID
jgi:hypothetical protein